VNGPPSPPRLRPAPRAHGERREPYLVPSASHRPVASSGHVGRVLPGSRLRSTLGGGVRCHR
jgi:hypothetical protein